MGQLTSWWTGRRVSTDRNHRWRRTPVPIFGRSKVTSSIVITINHGFNSTCRRKKTFPIPLKYIDGTWSTHTELDVLQEKRIDHYWNVDSGRHLSDLWRRFNLQKGWQRFKQLPDQIMKGQKFGRKVVKPVRIERYKNGQKKNRSSTMLENERNLLYWSRGRRIQRNSQ